MELDPEFRKLIDSAVEKAARKHIHVWFDFKSIFHGIVAGVVVAIVLWGAGLVKFPEQANSPAPIPPTATAATPD